MNLLSGTHDDNLQGKILDVLNKAGLTESEMNTARSFFDFSNELDFSLLESLTCRIPDCSLFQQSSCRLFDELLRISKEKSMEATDRYILFWDALAGNTVGNYLFNPSYMYKNNDGNVRLHHAYERRYPLDEVQMKMFAFAAYGVNGKNDLFSEKVLMNARKTPRNTYKAGKYCCCDDKHSREKLYSIALAFYESESFTKDELTEMQTAILELDSSLSENYTADIENLLLILFMSMNYSSALHESFINRMTKHCDRFIVVLLESVPSFYFKNNMAIIADAGENTDDYTPEKMIKRTVQAAVSADAFRYPASWNKAKNSLCFLEYLAQRYTEQYITCMSANEPLGIGAKWGYLFDYYNELNEILERAVPDAKQKYGIDSQKALAENAIHRETLEAPNNVRRQVMDYLRGDADLTIILSVREELHPINKGWAAMMHESSMLSQLKICGNMFDRYVSYKFIQSPFVLENYISTLFNNNKSEEAAGEIKNLLRAAIREKVPVFDRIKLFELIFERNSYWDNRKEIIKAAAVDIMAENEAVQDIYESEYRKYEVVTRCCYVQSLEKNNVNGKNKNKILAYCLDNSKEVRRTVTAIIGAHREYEAEVTEMLSSKKLTVRETAADIISLWGAENYRDLLQKAADTEKSAKLADKLRSMLNNSMNLSKEKEGENVFSPIAFIENIHKGGKARKISWLFEHLMPVVHFKDGNTADEKYMQAIILCYSSMPVIGRNENAFQLADELNVDELHRYAAEIFSRWFSAGAETKTKWAMYFSIIHGGDGMTDIALDCIKEWSENMRGAIAAEAVKAIALSGNSYALMKVDNLAHKFKQKQVKKAAVEAMESAAEALGITADELGDRIVPDLGFNENMERIFSYGERSFKVCLSPVMELEVYDSTGKKLKTIPAPGKKDDELLAKQSNAEFKLLKKQLKSIVSIQALRLETALISDRRWRKEDWESLFIKNPVMRSFAIGLIWMAYSGDVKITFRYMEDGTFNTVDEEEFELPENCLIGLVHPIDLDEAMLAAWKEQLSDYEIIQPINQLNRPIYRIMDNEKGKLDMNRFSGQSINALTLMGRATKLGWNKGSAQDAGVFYVYYREDITGKIKTPDGGFALRGTAAELNFSGCYIAVENEEVTLQNVRFYTPGTVAHGSYVYDEADNDKAILLENVPPRYFSEIIMQIEEIIGNNKQ